MSVDVKVQFATRQKIPTERLPTEDCNGNAEDFVRN